MAEIPRIPIICGPTGAGKTDAALKLAEKYPIEIISADSRQIIKHLNIGTGKPTVAEQNKVPFHLIDVIEPGERYSAMRFLVDATRAIKDILGRGKMPVIVGGTGLYLNVLANGVIEIEEEEFAIRQQLEEDLNRLGANHMWEQLQAIDPLEAAKVHPNNTVRLIRALEIFRQTGKTKSDLIATGVYKKSGYLFDWYCLAQPREILYERINGRVDKMIEAGLLNEVTGLLTAGMGTKQALSAVIGYGELIRHIEGHYSIDEAIAMIKQNSRRYAKRQLTWFRNQVKSTFFTEGDSLTRLVAL